METESSTFMLILAFVFIFLNAFFVLSEFAIVKVRRTRLEELAKENKQNAKMALEITSKLDSYLSATQLGITLSSLALGWIGEPAVSVLIEGYAKTYLHLSPQSIHGVAFAIAFTLITLLHVVLGELVPKSIAIAKAEKATLLVSAPLHMFWVVFLPIIRIFDFLAAVILRLIGIKRVKDTELAHSEEEIKIIVGESLKGGVLDTMESEIIKNAVDFSDTVAKEIMTPRKDLICLNKELSLEENLKIIHDSKFTRFPYVDGSKDSVIGMIHIRDIMNENFEHKNLNLDDIVRNFIIVPENSSISKLLIMMNSQKISAALVIDEYGGTAGFVTMEDIIEELLGSISDEHDSDELNYKKLAPNIYEFKGRYEIEDVEELTGIKFDEDIEQLTIGGYVFNLFGKLPSVGDKIEDENFFYEILKMDKNSIKLLKVTKKTPEIIEDKKD